MIVNDDLVDQYMSPEAVSLLDPADGELEMGGSNFYDLLNLLPCGFSGSASNGLNSDFQILIL